MAIDRRDEALLERAETLPVDAAALSETFDDMQENEDALSYSTQIDVRESMLNAVRLDVFRVLARKCKDELTLKTYVALLSDPAVSEQFAALEDEADRDACIREVFVDIAEEALDTVLVFDERYAEIDPRKKRYKRLVRQYVALLQERHGFDVDSEPRLSEAGLTDAEKERLLADAADTPVKIDDVATHFRDVAAECTDDDNEEEGIRTNDSLNDEPFFGVLAALSDATGGVVTIRGLKAACSHPDVDACMFRIDLADLDACMQGLQYEVAQRAVMAHPLFKRAMGENGADAELIASTYALQLIMKYCS